MDELNDWDKAREFARKEQANKDFQDSMAANNEAKKVVAARLAELGFTVIDISNDIPVEFSYSPFDFIIAKNLDAYVVDVKCKSSYLNYYWVSKRQLDNWNKYATPLTKIVVFVVYNTSPFDHYNKGEKRHKVEIISRFMTVESIKQPKSLRKNTIHINIEDTVPLEMLSDKCI